MIGLVTIDRELLLHSKWWGGTSRCGVLDLWTGLQIKNQELYTATALQLLLLPVVIQRNGQPLPAPAPAVAYALKFDTSYSDKQNSCVRPCILTQSTLRYTDVEGFGSSVKSDC